MGVMEKIFSWAGFPLTSPPEGAKEGAQFREAAGVTVDDDEDNWRRLTGDSNRDLSPMTQKRMRDMAAYLWEANQLANRLIELPIAYLLAEGVALTVDDEEHQGVLDGFWSDSINEMDIKLPKKVRELALYGEQFWPVFANEISGAVRLGYLDPGLIETVVRDPDNREQPIGIVTVKDKAGQARRYRIIVNGDEADCFTARTQAIRATFDDGECFYFAINDLSGTRGRSDLLSQADWLDGYDQFLFGELERSNFLRAFMWDVTLTGATPEEVSERAKKITAPRPGSVRVHNEAEQWKAETPGLQAGDGAEMARLLRNHVLGGATIPEHWFGGGGDVNRSTGESMSEPTLKILSMRQRVLKHILESVGRYVLRRWAQAHQKTYDPADEAWQVEAVFPELTAKDTSKYAAALQQVVVAVGLSLDKGLITRDTAVRIINSIAGRLGVEIDADQELTDARAEAATAAEADVYHTPASTE